MAAGQFAVFPIAGEPKEHGVDHCMAGLFFCFLDPVSWVVAAFLHSY